MKNPAGNGARRLTRGIRIKRAWAPLFMMAGITILSGSAGIQTGGWSFTGMDKVGHIAVFGLLAIAWVRVHDSGIYSPRRRWLNAVVLTTAFGLLDELHQYNNPLRTFEWADLMADFTGSVIAAAFYLKSRRIRKLLETEIV